MRTQTLRQLYVATRAPQIHASADEARNALELATRIRVTAENSPGGTRLHGKALERSWNAPVPESFARRVDGQRKTGWRKPS